ncbi:hypothetical protein AMAG_00412 [Allomyces macrogynus ATCC 38327]|uniref:Rad21/Rec8-like protein C-terminal eukaryotic domain-containing protein n=1 Tax=Allomyces macrogynus (strain ATCC 38327) TaxID=578462 RepID=A0A0L0RVV0_ALLM3|nr:hypothetical protein AMAG_00412 [Allomyces macrogynus ATCC 38327]|eukprot:KNE54438.1 hypothetical protein AMAG_00412 [Allomyces macrogynus ATCC 38327]
MDLAQPLMADLDPDLAEAMRTPHGPVVAPPLAPEEAEVPPPEIEEFLPSPSPPPAPEMENEVPALPAPPVPPVPPSPLAPEAARLAETPRLDSGVSPILPPHIPEAMTPSITEVETMPPLRLPSEEPVPFPEAPESPVAPPAEYMSRVEQESQHFLGFEDSLMDAADTSTPLFDDVVAAAGHARRAAAEGLFHVLALTSRGILRVAQDVPFGSIEIEPLH